VSVVADGSGKVFDCQKWVFERDARVADAVADIAAIAAERVALAAQIGAG
jgi:hypothetical protein